MNAPNPKARARSAARLAAVQALYQQHMEKTPLALLLNEFHLHRLGVELDGERMADASQGRPEGAPRAPGALRPTIPKDGAIPPHAALPEEVSYDAGKQRLHLGDGYIDHVSPAVWAYEVDRKQVIPQWFSYRKRDRSKPPMGDKRPPSPLQAIQPDHWLAEYTTDLLDLLNVLTLLVNLEPEQAHLLDRVCDGPLISEAELRAEGAIGALAAADTFSGPSEEVQHGLF